LRKRLKKEGVTFIASLTRTAVVSMGDKIKRPKNLAMESGRIDRAGVIWGLGSRRGKDHVQKFSNKSRAIPVQ